MERISSEKSPVITLSEPPTKMLDHVEEFIFEEYHTDLGCVLFSDHSLVEWSQKNGVTKPFLTDITKAISLEKGLLVMKLDGTVWLYTYEEGKYEGEKYEEGKYTLKQITNFL